jgi:hypothetical protein
MRRFYRKQWILQRYPSYFYETTENLVPFQQSCLIGGSGFPAAIKMELYHLKSRLKAAPTGQ